MAYDAPKGRPVLNCLWGVPHEYDFRRKFWDTDRAVAHYRRTAEGFARFLRDIGLYFARPGMRHR
ncbi:MAG TPA: hypothetical protein VG013_00170 [Gemmataceae bacterium]|jgi:hypothetical protein|nr:hypothetical protein [Gemmataceae bacterium]